MTPPAASNIRPAASLLILRDGPRGVEVLLMRRPERDTDFRSGACVFPGGVLDRADAQAHALCFGLDDTSASARLGLQEGGLDYFLAAVRESFEEVGLLFACQADGQPIDITTHAEGLRDWRGRLHCGEASIAELCQAHGWRLDLRDTAYFAHWLTPVTRPKRFDTRFFVRVAPADQHASPDFGEALELLWLTPDEALDPRRGLKLLNVTQKVLHSIRALASAQAGFEQALALRGVQRIFPRPALGSQGMRLVIDGEAAYAEVAHLDPEGRGDARCDLQPGDVTALSPRLWRVAGLRHNAYLVADTARTEAAVIDADAADALQLQALQALATLPVRQLFFTSTDAQPAALHTYWPQAMPQARPLPGQWLKIGSDAALQVLVVDSRQCAYRLEDELRGDSITVGEVAVPEPAARHGSPGWQAPRQGFMRPIVVASSSNRPA